MLFWFITTYDTMAGDVGCYATLYAHYYYGLVNTRSIRRASGGDIKLISQRALPQKRLRRSVVIVTKSDVMNIIIDEYRREHVNAWSIINIWPCLRLLLIIMLFKTRHHCTSTEYYATLYYHIKMGRDERSG